jgi:hypothetical protein
VLEHLVEAEAGGTQRRSRFFIERCREGEHDGFLALIAQLGFTGEGATAESSPFRELIFVVGAVPQRQQRAVEGVRFQIKQSDFLDQAAGFDKLPRARFAAGILELGLLFGEPCFLLFVLA